MSRIGELTETLGLVADALRVSLRAAEELGSDDVALACVDALGALRPYVREEVMRDP